MPLWPMRMMTSLVTASDEYCWHSVLHREVRRRMTGQQSNRSLLARDGGMFAYDPILCPTRMLMAVVATW